MKVFYSFIISIVFITFTGCSGGKPEPKSDSVNEEIVENALVSSEENSKRLNKQEMGAILLLNLIDYYSNVNKIRNVGIDNAGSEDTKLVAELRSSIDNLINDGADLNYKDEDGNTPVYIATINNDKNILEGLINNGANLDTKTPSGRSLLSGAIIENALDSAFLLLEKGANPDGHTKENEKPLSLALSKSIIDNSYTGLAVKIVEGGAETNIKSSNNNSILVSSLKMKNSELSLALIKNGANTADLDSDKLSVLNWSVIMRENEALTAIVESGFDESVEEISSLVLAKTIKNQEAYDYLMKNGFGKKGGGLLEPAVMENATNPLDTIKTSMNFLNVTESDESIKVLTKDQVIKNFVLKSPSRAVIDFSRLSGAENFSKKIEGKYLKRVVVGRHESFYRVVLYLKKGLKANISPQDGFVEVMVKKVD